MTHSYAMIMNRHFPHAFFLIIGSIRVFACLKFEEVNETYSCISTAHNNFLKTFELRYRV